ncbi:MAG: hypothetical protein OEW08_00235 [Gammaproteobacteria bacterium]|nr:hypothetical protein [Gammaproteobacteria bacterium]
MNKIATLCGLLAIGGFTVQATHAKDFDAAYKDAIATFTQAAGGNTDAVEKALPMFQEIDQHYPNHPAVLAHIGSLTTMMARDSLLPWNKIRYAENGLDIIDHALELAANNTDTTMIRNVPESLDVKLTAASTFSRMPRFFNRWGQAERLYQAIVDAARFADLPAEFRATVWLGRAQHANQRGNNDLYLAYLREAYTAGPQTQPGRHAAELLNPVKI